MPISLGSLDVLFLSSLTPGAQYEGILSIVGNVDSISWPEVNFKFDQSVSYVLVLFTKRPPTQQSNSCVNCAVPENIFQSLHVIVKWNAI
ncbi:MAG TPA: hypothetical protein VIH89_06515 [Candidatus Sulfotelmatobacter sp.]